MNLLHELSFGFVFFQLKQITRVNSVIDEGGADDDPGPATVDVLVHLGLLRRGLQVVLRVGGALRFILADGKYGR